MSGFDGEIFAARWVVALQLRWMGLSVSRGRALLAAPLLARCACAPGTSDALPKAINEEVVLPAGAKMAGWVITGHAVDRPSQDHPRREDAGRRSDRNCITRTRAFAVDRIGDIIQV
jgi:hypothetical protein